MSLSAPGPTPAPTGRRVVAPVDSLATLVGAHPRALLDLFRRGRATVPAELGDAPRGRLLALGVPKARARASSRWRAPLLRALATDLLPWQGKTFDRGGNSGQNVVLGREAFRFQRRGGPSALDGRPALVLTYDAARARNPWPLRAIRDELRTVGPGIAIGPAIGRGPRHAHVTLLLVRARVARSRGRAGLDPRRPPGSTAGGRAATLAACR